MTNETHSQLQRIPPSEITLNVRTPLRVALERLFSACRFLYYLFYWENNAIQLSRYELVDEKLPETIGELKIAQLSDLHGKVFRNRSKRLFELMAKEKPDLIVVTGDLVDERAFDLEYVDSTVRRARQIAPVFFVTGNHEADFRPQYRDQTLDAIERAGAIALDGRRLALKRRDGAIEILDDSAAQDENVVLIAGVGDPARFGREYKSRFARELTKVAPRDGRFSILLSHRPETLDLYAAQGFAVVFSGHAHGGQFRLPLVMPNGLNAPHQGWFPRYTGGLYALGETRLIVSRGLGPSVLPTRLFNRPDLVICRISRSSETKSR